MTPVKVEKLRNMLEECNYQGSEKNFLCEGFTTGFELGYRGPANRIDTSQNIPFTVGDKNQLWDKIMDEVQVERFAGPFKFEEILFKHYVQTPVGLVPKAGNKTRCIFHLSYDFKNGNCSINYWTPTELCSVKYNDLDQAVRNCLKLLEELGWNQTIFYSKADLKSAFRVLPLLVRNRCFLLLKAQHPTTGEWFYFIDKCLLFGASISCAHFQRFSMHSKQ